MSSVNIKRAIDNIRANTTVYTPIVEMIVNAIQAIEESSENHGQVSVRAVRDTQATLDKSPSAITGFQIHDNGIGFTDEHRNSFDTLYTDRRIKEGGKGFGRFTCLKYFENVRIASAYKERSGLKRRTFSMGRDHEIIVDEEVTETENQAPGTVVSLCDLKPGPAFEKQLPTVARNLVERLLPYFVSMDYVCPEIVLAESDGSSSLRLNDFVTNEVSAFIREMPVRKGKFRLSTAVTEETFHVRLFKIYSPRHHRSRLSLVAHKREVAGSVLHKYIPEFEDEFYDKSTNGTSERDRNYIIKAYVFGAYLDRHVSLERAGFEFGTESDVVYGIGQADIEERAASIAGEALSVEIVSRQEKKTERVRQYVDSQAPWHKTTLGRTDLSMLPYNPTDETIEALLQSDKFAQERAIEGDVSKLLSEGSFEDVQECAAEIVGRISGTSRNDLVHYIAFRRKILDIFERSLESDEVGTYSSEGVLHDIVFPRRGDTEKTSFEDHNLWIVDERLNFTNYVSSDVPLDGGNSERPDLLVYDKRVLFRGDNEASNAITIFEFKRPQLDDFVNPGSREDPIRQIIRYVNDIRDGKYKTPQGREMLVGDNTPFYGFVVCDLTARVERWLEREKNFRPMPDRFGVV